jgi:hypothetical protein
MACGAERWPVKILGDPMASQVKLTPHPISGFPKLAAADRAADRQ